MQNIEVNIELLKNIKDIINRSSCDEKKEYIQQAINGAMKLDAEAFRYMMQSIVEVQNSKTTDGKIKTLSEIKSKENHGEYITFIQDDKKHYIIGDLHADLVSFLKIMEVIEFDKNFENLNLVFLGDYIDRGKDKGELINRIALLKYLLPDTIHLLRGNHELHVEDENGNYVSPMLGADMSYLFNFLTVLATDEKYASYGVTKEVIKLYADLFDSMPTVALFNFDNIKILATHGGLPRADLNVDDYYNTPLYQTFDSLLDDNALDAVGIVQKVNMIWSDPLDGYEESFTDNSKVRFDYSQNQFTAFCKKYDVDLVFRAHEQQNNGYKSYFNDRLISVFSSGGRDKEINTVVNEKSYYTSVSPNILEIKENKVESININFTTEVIGSVEDTFDIDLIKNARLVHEENYESYTPSLDKAFIDGVEPKENLIQIIDNYNTKNKRQIIMKDEDEMLFTHSILQQFYGIYKSTKFSINVKTKEVINLSDEELQIDHDMIMVHKSETQVVDKTTIISKADPFFKVLNKSESINVQNRVIISRENAFSLSVVI
jgi:diadenosine tetraphosphatase ApaH/serine/threonine PP2A family protein phosphatase